MSKEYDHGKIEREREREREREARPAQQEEIRIVHRCIDLVWFVVLAVAIVVCSVALDFSPPFLHSTLAVHHFISFHRITLQ